VGHTPTLLSQTIFHNTHTRAQNASHYDHPDDEDHRARHGSRWACRTHIRHHNDDPEVSDRDDQGVRRQGPCF